MPFFQHIMIHLMPHLRDHFRVEDRLPPRFLNLLAQIRDQEEPTKAWAWSR